MPLSLSSCSSLFLYMMSFILTRVGVGGVGSSGIVDAGSTSSSYQIATDSGSSLHYLLNCQGVASARLIVMATPRFVLGMMLSFKQMILHGTD